MSSYKYLPLFASDEIRLLTLFKGKRRSIVECKLSHASLSSSTTYEALSYTWGSENNLQPIFIDGHVVQIRENLASALQHLRYEDADRKLWVDSLCINQSNIEERNHQVLRMGSIFQRAKSVQAWLGIASDDSGEAFALMMDINKPDWRANFLKDLADGGDAIVHEFQRWKAIAVLMERPWFRRRWVVQEVAFAADVLVHCGSLTITWEGLSNAIAFLREYGRVIWKNWQSRLNTTISSPSFQNSKGLEGDFSAQRASRLVVASKEVIHRDETTNTVHRLHNLEALVFLFPDFKVSDLRDIIYALIPLAKDVHDSKEWLPDYSKPYQQVWEQYVSYVIRDTGSLNLICRPWVRWPISCPSWMLYLSLQMAKPGDMIRRVPTTENLFVGRPWETSYKAAGSSRADYKISQGILFTKGFWVDTITAIGSTGTDKNHDQNLPLDWRNMALEIIKQRDFPTSQSSMPIDLIPEEICDTLVAGRASDGGLPDASYKQACDLLWRSKTAKEPLESIFSSLSESEKASTSRFLSRVRECTRNRKFATTSLRRLGLVWSGARPKDIVCVLMGCSVPVILRKEGQQYVLRGESYIHGIMDGQAMKGLESGLYALQDFAIK